MRIMGWIGVILIAIIFILWLGFQIPPRAFDPPPVQAGAVESVPLRADLPAPVERFFRTLYGDSVPVYSSVVMTGPARIRPAGPWHLPARTRFIHETGQAYRHYIEITWFGLPIMAVDEGYVDGASFFCQCTIGQRGEHAQNKPGSQPRALGGGSEFSLAACHRHARALGAN